MIGPGGVLVQVIPHVRFAPQINSGAAPAAGGLGPIADVIVGVPELLSGDGGAIGLVTIPGNDLTKGVVRVGPVGSIAPFLPMAKSNNQPYRSDPIASTTGFAIDTHGNLTRNVLP